MPEMQSEAKMVGAGEKQIDAQVHPENNLAANPGQLKLNSQW